MKKLTERWQLTLILAIVLVPIFYLIGKTIWIHYAITGKLLP